MLPEPEAQRIKTTLLIFWIIWVSNLLVLGVLYLVLSRQGPVVVLPANSFASLAGFVPLFVSIIIRWLVLPRATQPGAALVMFVIGVALAEACGILGLLLGGPYREDLFLLGVLGVAQFVPFFAKQLFVPKPSGFIPNN